MSVAYQRIEDKLKQAKEKERKLMKLLYIIKKRGVPIDEIFDEVNSTKSSLERSKLSPTKPSIPKLDLETLEKEDSDDFEPEDGLFDSGLHQTKTLSN